MKVMKFGGTSVGSVAGVMSVTRLVEAVDEPVVVVVSALSGVTDNLVSLGVQAVQGDRGYEEALSEIISCHTTLIDGVITDGVLRKKVKAETSALFDELTNMLKRVSLVNDLPATALDTIVSYGERLSSLIVAYALSGAVLFDSRKFIKTFRQFDKHIVDFTETNRLIKKTFTPLPKVSVVPGFIASSRENGEVTNLGRGGSDYTASIVATALDASVLEIWTDVDGFMTADPKVIGSAYVIDRLSFVEAMELCHFGAKVIYPPTLYPVYHKNIPIRIRNTFRLSAPGTYISQEAGEPGKALIKGISSIDDTCLITVKGLGMVGVIGINYRIFKALAQSGISVFMVAQASSENNTTFAVRNTDAELSVKALRDEFAMELAQGEISAITADKGLSTVAIVGETMKQTPGIAGKLFGTLGRAGISVIACAQGASETNISFVINSQSLRKALNSIHDSFFLSEYKVLNLFIVGVGTVGSKLIEQIRSQQATLMEQNSLKLRVVGVANSTKLLFNRDGLQLDTCIAKLKAHGIGSSPRFICDEILRMNIFNSVFVDCTASPEIAALYEDLLEHNISVVAANKVAASSEYSRYVKLKETARRRDVKYLFETNVGAGLPIINTMNDLINSGDHILRLEAVLSGSLNFIFNTISADIPFSKAILMAKEARYAEPDPRIDLSGADVKRKLVILAREAGYAVEQKDVKTNLFIPERYFEGAPDNFWAHIHELDDGFEALRRRVEADKKRIRIVAKMDKGACEIGLQEVDRLHPFYQLEGSNNIIMISTERYNDYPMIIKGYGAGEDVTAAGVFADIISIANIR